MSRLIHEGDPKVKAPWHDPEPDELNSPEFEAIWQTIKRWDINVPDVYAGDCGATGNHVVAILHALQKAGFLALTILLCSCGPFIDVKHGIVSTGFLSQTQGFSGSLKNKDGSVVWSVVGHDSTSVANTAIGFLGTAKIADDGVKSLQNSANATTAQQANAQASTLALQQDAEKATAAGVAAKNLNAAQTTARAAGVPALAKP